MADTTNRRAPRVPPSPTSLAAAVSGTAQALLNQHDALLADADMLGDDDAAFEVNSRARRELLERLATAPALSLSEYMRKCHLLFDRSVSAQQMPQEWAVGLISDAVRLFTAVRS